MSSPLIFDTTPSLFDGPAIVPLPVRVETAEASRDVGDEHGTAAVPQSIFALHLVNGEHYSGAERVQDLLARQLPTFGCDVSFVCVKPQLFPIARETKTAPLIEMPMRSRFDLRVVKRIADIVRSEDFDLIHAHTPRTALVGRLAAQKAGVPFVYHVHSPAGRDSTRRLFNWINATTEWAAVRGADRLIAVSPSVRDYMICHGIAADRIVCVPNGVPGNSNHAERHRPTGTWTLGVAALFRPRKGIEVLLEALAMLRSRGVNVRLRGWRLRNASLPVRCPRPCGASRPGRCDRLDRFHTQR